MTCSEGWTSCNGFTLLVLSVLAILLNLTPIIIDYSEDARLLHNPTSCFEWFLPGILGGGLLVLPAVSMSLASRKRASCNSRCGMITSAILSLVSILGAAYCCLISVYAVAEGPLICQGGNKDVSSCDFTLMNLSSFNKLNFDMQWFTEASCVSNSTTNGTSLGYILDGVFDFTVNEEFQRILHLTTYVGLSVIGIIEILVSISQVAAGMFGCICGTSRKKQNRTV